MSKVQRRIISIVIIILVLCAYAFLNSSYFSLDELEWSGLTFLAPSDLLAETSYAGRNVFRIDKGELAEQIRGHIWIKDAAVAWKWPNHLSVKVTERKPVALVVGSDSWFVLDDEGVVLPPPRGFNFGSLPLVTNIDLDAGEQFISIARLLAQLPTGLYENVSEWNSLEQTLITRAGTQILLGNLRDLDRKLAALDLILQELAKRSAVPKRIDLRVANSPVIIE
jgi:cell division protein FtsQ